VFCRAYVNILNRLGVTGGQTERRSDRRARSKCRA